MVAYNESINFDKAFYKQDIRGSIAFARANCKTGILTKEEFGKIEAGLRQVEREWADGTFRIVPGVDEVLPIIRNYAGIYTLLTLRTRTSTLPMSAGWARSSTRASPGSCTPDGHGTIRSQPICACG